MRVKDLPELINRIDARGIYHRPPFLHCAVCGGEYSAHRGDYFAAHPETQLACCGRAMRLVRRVSRLIRVKPGEVERVEA
jgi:hypothetical protein